MNAAEADFNILPVICVQDSNQNKDNVAVRQLRRKKERKRQSILTFFMYTLFSQWKETTLSRKQFTLFSKENELLSGVHHYLLICYGKCPAKWQRIYPIFCRNL